MQLLSGVGGRIAGFSSQKSQSLYPFQLPVELPCGSEPLEKQLNNVLIVSPKTSEQLTLSDKVTKRSLISNPVSTFLVQRKPTLNLYLTFPGVQSRGNYATFSKVPVFYNCLSVLNLNTKPASVTRPQGLGQTFTFIRATLNIIHPSSISPSVLNPSRPKDNRRENGTIVARQRYCVKVEYFLNSIYSGL